MQNIIRLFTKITFLIGFYSISFLGYAQEHSLSPAAEQLEEYLPLLNQKRVGLVAHAASQLYAPQKPTHLVDTLLARNVKLVKIFAPEHGFRSREDNGAIIKDELDSLTQLPIISLHGKNKKPQAQHLENIDVLLFDLQDVGARFYTYLSTLHLTMEACAENNIPIILLDRPNPNGHYVDGPVMEDAYKGYLGMHNIPIVHGLTLGEFANMINGEKWLPGKAQCDLTVIKIKGYTHSTSYDLPVRPSPNLPNVTAINLYPSLCLFEQTPVSIGRGTEQQFQRYGHPYFQETFSFIPQPNFGAKKPKLQGQKCFGENLVSHPRLDKLELKWLLKAYHHYPEKDNFFKKGFVKLAGTKSLQEQIQKGWSEEEIRRSWEPELSAFKAIRKKYLLYPN